METVAITLTLLGTVGTLFYIGSKFKTSDEGGTKYGAIYKVLFNTIAFTIALTLPFAGMEIAALNEFEDLQALMGLTTVPLLITYILYLVYLFLAYGEDMYRSVAGKPDITEGRFE